MGTQIHFDIAEKDKQKLATILKSAGLTPAEACQLFAKKVIEVGGLPFDISKPNERVQLAINSQDYVAFKTPKEGLTWLNN